MSDNEDLFGRLSVGDEDDEAEDEEVDVDDLLKSLQKHNANKVIQWPQRLVFDSKFWFPALHM